MLAPTNFSGRWLRIHDIYIYIYASNKQTTPEFDELSQSGPSSTGSTMINELCDKAGKRHQSPELIRRYLL